MTYRFLSAAFNRAHNVFNFGLRASGSVAYLRAAFGAVPETKVNAL